MATQEVTNVRLLDNYVAGQWTAATSPDRLPVTNPATGEVTAQLALAGTGSMLGAALVLVTHDRSMARAAITQGTLPALAVLFLLLSM